MHLFSRDWTGRMRLNFGFRISILRIFRSSLQPNKVYQTNLWWLSSATTYVQSSGCSLRNVSSKSLLLMKRITWRTCRLNDRRLVYPSSGSVSMSSCCQGHQRSQNPRISSTLFPSSDQIYLQTLGTLGSATATPKLVDSRRASTSMALRSLRNSIFCWRTISWSEGWRRMCWISCPLNDDLRSGSNATQRSPSNFNWFWLQLRRSSLSLMIKLQSLP